METKVIDGLPYTAHFNYKDVGYTTLRVIDKVGHYDRIASLISEIYKKMQCRSVVFGSLEYDGYIPVNCTNIQTSFLFNCTTIVSQPRQCVFLSDLSIINDAFVRKCILYVDEYDPEKYDTFILTYSPIIISNISFIEGYACFPLTNTATFVLVPVHLQTAFMSAFTLHLVANTLTYDNLINLCVMVKDGGNDFVSMLESTLPYIDRWTILDTGSTDDTVANVSRIMARKQGTLYQEPFINFGASRNRCLELAGTQCTYNIMLDDTYHMKGDIRAFLESIRGDQSADSFSLFITQPDIEYASNRVFKSKRNLKYKYAIHEVIEERDNMNIIIPKENAYISDAQSGALIDRTIARKQQDLDMLQAEIDANPCDPRPYYYMAQTYNGMEQFENAYNWFLKRIYHDDSGFEQEKHEACIEAGRIAQFILNKSPAEYLKLYELAHTVDPERPDSLYFLGAYYYLVEPDIARAFGYLHKGFKLGFPTHRQYCLKPSITYTHIPKLLTSCCYNLGEHLVGLEASSFYLKHNDYQGKCSQDEVVLSWNKIFDLLVQSNKIKEMSLTQICCFIAPCGIWKRSDMGNSETMIVELAARLHLIGRFRVIVFCNCEREEIYEDVRYIPLGQLFHTLHTQFIHTCIISKCSEYLPVVINTSVQNIYLMTDDVAFSGNVITVHDKLKGVICLSKWHKECIGKLFPTLKSIIQEWDCSQTLEIQASALNDLLSR